MGILKRLADARDGGEKPARKDHALPDHPSVSGAKGGQQPLKNGKHAKPRTAAQRIRPGSNDVGIPPLKQPTLPPGRSGILILCTGDRKPYWHVFKKAPGTELGWSFERHLSAVPKKPRDKSTSTEICKSSPQQVGPEKEGLDIGGRDWGDWRCPGCGQCQTTVSNGFLHLTTCRCGANICHGPGRDGDANATCPNCATIRYPAGYVGMDNLSGIHSTEQKNARSPSVESPNRRQLG